MNTDETDEKIAAILSLSVPSVFICGLTYYVDGFRNLTSNSSVVFQKRNVGA